jgi:hypothetical protein
VTTRLFPVVGLNPSWIKSKDSSNCIFVFGCVAVGQI